MVDCGMVLFVCKVRKVVFRLVLSISLEDA